MSESSRDASRGLKLSPPRSLMNLEDAEEIWTIITKRYPKAAPLLCEMETVLDHAEDLLEQLKSPSDLGIVLSTDESLNVEESEEIISDKTDLREDSLANHVEFNRPSVLETEQFNIDYVTLTETMLTVDAVDKNEEVSFINQDSKIISTSLKPTYAVGESESSFYPGHDDREESGQKLVQEHSEDSTQRELINDMWKAKNTTLNYNKGSRPSSASRILGNPVTRLLQSPRRQRTHSEETKIVKKAIPKLQGSPRKNSTKTEISIPHFKKVVETIRSKEEMHKKTENLKNDTESQEKLEEIADIIRKKVKDSASIEGWDKVVGNSQKSCEISPLAKDKYDQEISSDGLINKTDVSPKSNTIPVAVEAKINIQSGSHQKNEKTVKTESPGCGDEINSTLTVHESPVIILEQYANVCNKTVNYITNDDRKGKIEITCNFANYKVSSGGKVQEVVKNEAAARMLHLLATSQMEENIVGDLQEFSRQQMLEIMKLDKGDTFIPSVQKMAMVRLYNFCLDQNLPEPEYETKPDKQYGLLSTCKILDCIGKGVGRTDGTAKEKAAEDFYKKHFEKLKNQLKEH